MTLRELFASGHIVDAILVVLIAEAALLIYCRRDQASSRSVNVAAATLPGVFLLLALRAALTGASWMWIALWLALSFPAHLTDLWRRPP